MKTNTLKSPASYPNPKGHNYIYEPPHSHSLHKMSEIFIYISDSLSYIHVVKFEVLMGMGIKIQIFSDVTPCALVNSNVSKKFIALIFTIVLKVLHSGIHVILNGLLKDITYLPRGTR